MRKKLIGKVGAMLMAAAMAFSGTIAAFADEMSNDPEKIYEALVEQDQDEALSQKAGDIMAEGDGYTISEGYLLKNGKSIVVNIDINDDLTGDKFDQAVSRALDNENITNGLLLQFNTENPLTKSNLQKMKNKNTGLHVILKNSDSVSSIVYVTESLTNVDTDFTATATVNADNEAAKKIKDSGIEYYVSLTTAGKSGDLLPGNGTIYFDRDLQKNDFSVRSRPLGFGIGNGLYGYYYNESTGRFVKLSSDKENQQVDVMWNSETLHIPFMDCDYKGTYAITQGELPDSLLMDTYTGLSYEGNNWVYYNNGKIDTSYTGLCKYNGSWWYVENGSINFNATGLCKYNGSWWYVNNGKVDFSSTTLCKYNGSWWYVSGGKVNFNATGLCKYNGSWWYVSGGKVNFNATGLCKYNGSWWYVRNGKVDFSSTTLCKYNGSWWYVSGGRVNFGATGLCKYNGSWWYVKNGQVSFTTTLCKYSGTWWYIENGKINFNKTTLVKYGNNWYAVAGGKVAWNYSGKLNYNGGTFKVVKGVVKF